MNRANVSAHMENYEIAISDYELANQIEANPTCPQAVERIKERMQFTKQAFERAVSQQRGRESSRRRRYRN